METAFPTGTHVLVSFEAGVTSRKPTWLYAMHIDPPPLRWGKGEQRIDPVQLARHGYAKARRVGITALAGGKRKTEIRNATPREFRDVLLAIAATVPGLSPGSQPRVGGQT